MRVDLGHKDTEIGCIDRNKTLRLSGGIGRHYRQLLEDKE